MDYKQLEYFLTIAEEKSLSKAAHNLFVSQQALSKVIENLEEELEVPLFVRSNKGVELTKYGRELQKQAKTYVTTHNQIIEHMHDLRNESNKQLTIGYATGLAQQLPPNFFSNFILKHPEIDIHLRSYSDDSYNRSIQTFDVDVYLCTMITSTLNELNVIYHFEHKPFLLMSKNHPLASKEKITIRDLQKEKFISLNTDNDLRESMDNLYNKYGLKVNSYIAPAEYELVYELLTKANFVSFYATHYNDEKNLLINRPITITEEISYNFYILTRNSPIHNPVIDELVSELKTYFESMEF